MTLKRCLLKNKLFILVVLLLAILLSYGANSNHTFTFLSIPEATQNIEGQKLPFLKTEGNWIKDAYGIIILRGCDYMGLEVGWFNHKESDFKKMKCWGFNVVRLPIAWNYVEPTPGYYSDTYLMYVDRIISWCKKYGLYVVLDMHQWHWSNKFRDKDLGITGNGAPLWAVEQYATEVEAAVGFWKSDSLKAHFAEMWSHVASRYANESTVAAYDIFNEPGPGGEEGYKRIIGKKPEETISSEELSEAVRVFNAILHDFTEDVIAEIRFVDSNHIIIYEPSWGKMESISQPNLVLSPHVYPSDTWEQTLDFMAYFDRYAVEELEIPWWIGEFGTENGAEKHFEWLNNLLALMDRYRVGGAVWTYWKCDQKYNWMIALLWKDGAANEDIINILDRMYPTWISREPSYFSYEVSSYSTSYQTYELDLKSYNFKIAFPATGEDVRVTLHVPASFPVDFRVSSTAQKWDYAWNPNNRFLTFSATHLPLEKVTFMVTADFKSPRDLWLKPYANLPLTRRSARICGARPSNQVRIEKYNSDKHSYDIVKTLKVSNFNCYDGVTFWNGLDENGHPCWIPGPYAFYIIEEEMGVWKERWGGWITLSDDIRPPDVTQICQTGNSVHFYVYDPDSPEIYVKINVYRTWGEYVTSLLGDDLSHHWELKRVGAYNVGLTNLPLGKYMVKITAIDSAGNECPQDRVCPDPPKLLSPLQDSVISNPEPTFRWVGAVDYPPSSGISNYEIQIDDDADFSSPVSALFIDNFEHGALNWKKHNNSGPWQVIDGQFCQMEPKEYAMQQGYGTYNFAYVPNVSMDLVMIAKVTLLEPLKTGKDAALGIFVHNPSGETYDKWALVFHYSHHAYTKEEVSTLSLLEEWVDWRDSTPFIMEPGIPYWFEMKVVGNEVWGKAWKVGDSEPPWMVHDLFTKSIYNKAIGLYSSHHKASFDDVTVMPIDFLLDNDFNTADTSAWSASKYQPGISPWWWYTSANWTVKNSEYVGKDPKHMYNYAGDESWTDYVVSVRVKPTTPGWRVGLRARVKDGNNLYQIHSYSGGLRISKLVNGNTIDFKWVAIPIPLDQWHSLAIKCVGNYIMFYFNGQLQHFQIDSQFRSGGIGLCAWNENIVVHFDDAKVVKLMTQTWFKPSDPLNASRYCWRVRAVDNVGNVGEWSEYRSFIFLGSRVVAADEAGRPKRTFNIPETVYISGRGYSPSTAHNLYIVNDKTWVDSISIPDRVLRTGFY